MDSDEESPPGSPASNAPSSPAENASNSDGSDFSDSDSGASGQEDGPKSPRPSRERSSSRSSNDSSNDSHSAAGSPEPQQQDQHHGGEDVVSRDDSSISRDAIEASSRPEQATAAEEISADGLGAEEEDSPQAKEEGEQEEEEKESVSVKPPEEEKKNFDLAHEDLSDVSDVDSGSSMSGHNDRDDSPVPIDDDADDSGKITDLRQKLNARKKSSDDLKAHSDDFPTTNGTKFSNEEKRTDEDALDFEAEDGECADDSKELNEKRKEEEEEQQQQQKTKDPDEELEEGEVTDDDERRPEETEPKPVCRFYARGQCTWGVSCRFLHPGVTDKGNYTMFDMVRPIAGGGPPPLGGYDYRERAKAHIPPAHHAPALGLALPAAMLPRPSPLDATAAGESPWERGLRTAKEMLRKANKRKEQDIDFEDKKMNLSSGQDDLDRDYYSMDRPSPELSPPPPAYPARAERFSPPPRGPPPRARPFPPEEDAFGRTPRYRELPPHRMPQYEDERRVRPVREVIVQRSEPVRDDEWSDPWMRSKSPAGREKGRDRERDRGRDRSWSSKSYSSSSSSQSDSSSESSRSRSPPAYSKRAKKRSERRSRGRDPVKAYPERPEKRFPYGRQQPEGRRHSPSPILSSNKRALERISASQHQLKRRKVSPPPPARENRKFDRRPPRRSRSSSSGSSESSGSDSESSGSSSSDDSSKSPGGGKKKPGSHRQTETVRHKTTSERTPKTAASEGKETSSGSAASAAKKTTRREELLKQLKAVEDAIARKRSKIAS